MRTLGRATAVWVVIIAVETVHGTLRTLLLAPAIGDLRARQVSVVTGTLLIFLVALAFSRWIGARSTAGLLGIGALWVGLTIAFEVALGRVVLGYDAARILADYDVGRGGFMAFGLAAMAAIPLVAARLREGRDGRSSTSWNRR